MDELRNGGELALDWLTLRSAIEPIGRREWQGSIGWGRFEHRRGWRAKAKRSHGQFAVEMSGEFFRTGGDYAGLVDEVWGRPPPPMSASRVDVACEIHAFGEADPSKVALKLAERMPPARWGLAWNEHRSCDGYTVYVGAAAQGGRKTEDMRARSDYYLRCYVESSRPRVMRCELEVKHQADRSAYDCIVHAFSVMGYMTSRPWSVDARTQVERMPKLAADGRAQPQKLLRQAAGLIACAHARRNGEGPVLSERVQWAWSEIVHAVLRYDAMHEYGEVIASAPVVSDDELSSIAAAVLKHRPSEAQIAEVAKPLPRTVGQEQAAAQLQVEAARRRKRSGGLLPGD